MKVPMLSSLAVRVEAMLPQWLDSSSRRVAKATILTLVAFLALLVAGPLVGTPLLFVGYALAWLLFGTGGRAVGIEPVIGLIVTAVGAGTAVFFLIGLVLTLQIPFAAAWVALQRSAQPVRTIVSVAVAVAVASTILFLRVELPRRHLDRQASEFVAGDIDGSFPDLGGLREISYAQPMHHYCAGLCSALLWSGRLDRVVLLPSLHLPGIKNLTPEGLPAGDFLTGFSYRIGRGDDCLQSFILGFEDTREGRGLRSKQEQEVKNSAFFREGTCLIREASFAKGFVALRFLAPLSVNGGSRIPSPLAERTAIGDATGDAVQWRRIKTAISRKRPDLFDIVVNENKLMEMLRSSLIGNSVDANDAPARDADFEKYFHSLPHEASRSAAVTLDREFLKQRRKELEARVLIDSLTREMLDEALHASGVPSGQAKRPQPRTH